MSRLDRLLERIFGADAAQETDPQAGLLSYAGEWHALIAGLGAGVLTTWSANPAFVLGVVSVALGVGPIGQKISSRVALTELRREPWYAIGGALITSAPYWLREVLGVVPA